MHLPALHSAPPHLEARGVALVILGLLLHNLIIKRHTLCLAPPHAVPERAARKAARTGYKWQAAGE